MTTTIERGPVASMPCDQVDAEFSHLMWTNFSGPDRSHSWAAHMTDNELETYLDSFVSRGGGQRLDDGSLGWYDPERGVAIIQRSEYSMTGYKMSYEDFRGRLSH